MVLAVGATTLPAAATTGDPDADALLSLLNGERTSRGLAPVRVEATLSAGAAAHAQALEARDRLFHTAMTDTAPAGWRRLGENVAVAGDAGAAHRALMASPTHRAVMLDPSFDYVGLGVRKAGPSLWVSMKFADHPVSDLPATSGPSRRVSRKGVVTATGLSFHGDLSGVSLAAPIVALVPTPSGSGYWLVGADGGVFTFGDASWHGSLGGRRLAAPVVGMTALPDAGGYWLVAADGGVFSFGRAPFLGSAARSRLRSPVTGIDSTGSGGGYALRSADGTRHGFGDAG